MRGTIVVPDDFDTMTGIAPVLASMCETLPRTRYLKAKARDGLTVAQAIYGMYRTMVWCHAAFEGKKYPQFTGTPLAQRGLERKFTSISKALDRGSNRYRKLQRSNALVVLPDSEFGGMLAFRADLVLTATEAAYQVYQYHLRRAFYTFDRDSGFIFPGGDRSYLNVYEQSVVSKLFPIW